MSHLSPNRELEALIPNFRPSFVADDFLLQLQAACDGLGVVAFSRSFRGSALGITPLPLKFDSLAVEMHIVCPRSSLAITRVRHVVDKLRAFMRERSAWE